MILRTTIAAVTVLAAVTVVLPRDEAAKAESSQFLRFVEAADGAATLETAVVRYKDAKGRIVDLIGAVHVGDAEYYRQLNKIFRGYDSLLYEMVKPKDKSFEPRSEEAGDPAESTRHSGSWVSSFQRFLKDVLELEFQLDGIDYAAKNFVHADLDAETFARKQKERGESILTLMLKASLDQMKALNGGDAAIQESAAAQASLLLSFFAKDRAKALKRVLGKQFGELEKIAAGFETGPSGEESVLVVERNKACLAVLEEALAKGDKRVGIFYGAAHFPDMERRLAADFGLKPTTTDWLVAWDIE